MPDEIDQDATLDERLDFFLADESTKDVLAAMAEVVRKRALAMREQEDAAIEDFGSAMLDELADQMDVSTENLP